MSKKNIVIYPGTFDPITNGHVDLIQRALRLFDGVCVAIAENINKKAAFSLTSRLELASTVLAAYTQVEVCSFNGLLIEFVKQRGMNIIVRGVRTLSDIEHEFQLASMNRQLMPDIETVFLMPTEQYTYLSSTLVKEVAALGGDVSKFVDPVVALALKGLC